MQLKKQIVEALFKFIGIDPRNQIVIKEAQ